MVRKLVLIPAQEAHPARMTRRCLAPTWVVWIDNGTRYVRAVVRAWGECEAERFAAALFGGEAVEVKPYA